MTQWINNNHESLFTASLASLFIAVAPDAIASGDHTLVIMDQALQGISIIKESIQAIAGLVTIIFTIMLICTKMSEFKKWFKTAFNKKRKNHKHNHEDQD